MNAQRKVGRPPLPENKRHRPVSFSCPGELWIRVQAGICDSASVSTICRDALNFYFRTQEGLKGQLSPEQYDYARRQLL